MKQLLLYSTLVLIILLGCQDEGDFSPEITYARSGCYGPCPQFSIHIFSDGTLEYIGLHFVKVQDTVTEHITDDQVTQLNNAFEECHYFSLKDSYLIGPTDFETIYTSYKVKGICKAVTHYEGDQSAPAALDTLYVRIEKILNVARWVGTNGPF